MRVSVLPVNIAPATSCIFSSCNDTAPELTEKSVELNDAIPFVDVVASSPLIVIVFVEATVEIPVPPAIVSVSESKSIDCASPESAATSKSSAVMAASTYALIALAEANVSSEADTLERSVSSTPDFRLSTSKFVIVVVSASIEPRLIVIVLEVIAVVILVPPATVNVCPRLTPSDPESPATVTLEFVNDEFCIFEIVVELASIAARSIVTVFYYIVVSILVPPVKVKVSPVVNVSVPVSPVISNDPDGTAANDITPEPSTVKNCPFENEPGKVNVTSDAWLFGAFNATKFEPLSVPSLNLIVPPVDVEFPINSSSIALFESTRIAELAVNVP